MHVYLYTQTHRDSDGSPARHLSLSHRICQAECWHLLLESYPEKHAFPGNLCTNECKPGVHMIPYVPPETILSADGSLAHYRGKHAKQSADHLIPLSMHSRCAKHPSGETNASPECTCFHTWLRAPIRNPSILSRHHSKQTVGLY